jgi:hypothetical protein
MHINGYFVAAQEKSHVFETYKTIQIFHAYYYFLENLSFI